MTSAHAQLRAYIANKQPAFHEWLSTVDVEDDFNPRDHPEKLKALLDRLSCSECRTCRKKKGVHLRCSGCSVAYYCDIKCQRADWPKHKQICEFDKFLKGAFQEDYDNCVHDY